MTPQAFAADLATIPAMDDLTVRICSGGGDVWAAQAIGAMLENRLGTVTAQIEGICASAATIVASHCKVVKAAEDATYMIHPIKVNPNGFVDMEGLKQLMDALTVMRTNVLNQYAKKTGHTVEEVAAWMDATSWWTAAEAKENGFIDEITESNQTAKIENRNGALFVNSIAVPGTFDDAPEFVRNRAVVAPATTEGFVNNTDPAGKPDKNDGGNDMEFKNADELRNGCPDLVKEIVDEAHAEAQKQERDRLAAIMGSKALDLFLDDLDIRSRLDTKNYGFGVINVKELPNGLTYYGHLNDPSMDIYCYNEYYLDDWTDPEHPATKPLVDPNKIILINHAPNFLMGYGLCTYLDDASKQWVSAQTDRLLRSYVEHHPDRRLMEVQSHPLPIPDKVDSWMVVEVCAAD